MSDVCVRVAVRVRPLLRKEILHNHRVCLRVVPGAPQVLLGSDRLFSFDHAFGPAASQTELYQTCVQPLVGSLVEGCNATVFCYGQTGSGKTYTLGGGKMDDEGGIIDLVAQDMFVLLGEKTRCSEDVKATVRVSYMELYKEELRDLLELHTSEKELHIREDDRGNTVVVGATEMVVTSAEELLGALEMGNALRHTSATGMNEHSSRSHAILTLHLTQGVDTPRSSKLNLVDLAGSERAGKTGNTGVRLKESVHINTSLLALGNVIRALSDHGRGRRGNHLSSLHIPYRDAKLTRLLRDSLGGASHTLLVACISPSHHSIAESLSVLQFATKARHIRNRPGAAEVKSCPAKWEPGEGGPGEPEYEVQTLKELLKEREKEQEAEREKKEGRVGGEEALDRSSQTCDSEPDKEAGREEEGAAAASRCCLLLQEAAALLLEVGGAGAAPGPTFKQQLQDWQEKLRSVRHSHQADDPNASGRKERQDAVVSELRRQLKKCQRALKVNKQLLEQKDVELRHVQEDTETLLEEQRAHLQTLDEKDQRLRIQSEQLVDQTILINRLRGNLTSLKGAMLGSKVEPGASGDSDRRPNSVPVIRHGSAHTASRKIQSSPPTYSLERVMAAFKMRSHLLLAQMEDQEEVFCPFTNGQWERNQAEEKPRLDDATGRTRASLNRTWTSSREKTSWLNQISGLDQTGKKIPFQPSQQGSKEEHQARRKKNEKLRASATQRKIQLLSTNMRMKEELIRDLDNTDKETRALGKRKSGEGEAGALASLSEQSRQWRAEVSRSLQHMSRQRLQLQHNLKKETSKTRASHGVDATACESQCGEFSKEKACDRCWLEKAEERVLQRRAELEELEEELQRRKEVLQERAACLQQKNQLEIKKLRSSQALGQDLLRVSVQLQSVKEQLQRDDGQRAGVTREELEQERDRLRRKRDALDAQLKDNTVLTQEEEHSLLQLEEAIEALDAALEFKTLSIQDKQKRLSMSDSTSRPSANTEDGDLHHLMKKLKELQPPEASELLVKYFNKVVFLREAERHLRLRCEELELQAGEQEALVREMEAAMQRVALGADRRITQLQRDHQSNIQLLLHKLREGSLDDTQQATQDQTDTPEKEVFLLKSSSHQFKKKLTEAFGDTKLPAIQPLYIKKDTQTLGLHGNGNTNKPQLQTEKVKQTKAGGIATSMKMQAEHKDKHKHKDALQESWCRSASFERQTPGSAPHYVHTLETSQERSERSERSERRPSQCGESSKMIPVRICRRGLRPICSAELQLCNSAARRRQAAMDSFRGSTLEDSIEGQWNEK